MDTPLVVVWDQCFGESEMIMLLKTNPPSGPMSFVRYYLGLLSQERQNSSAIHGANITLYK